MHKEPESTSMPTKAGRSWRQAFVTTSVLFALISAAALSTPAILTRTPLRNQMLSPAFAKYGLSTAAENASGGWMHPVAFEGIELRDKQGRVICRIRELRTSHSLLRFMSGDADLGQLTIVDPQIDIYVNDDGTLPWNAAPASMGAVLLDFVVENGGLRINVPWREIPLVDISSLNISGRIDRDDAGERMLTVDAFQVFDREKLSEKHTAQNLALIAPVLSQSTRVTGEASVYFEEFRLPLDSEDDAQTQFPIRGQAEFHSLQAHLKQDWVRQLTQLTGELAKADLPDRIEITRDSVVEFSVSREGVFHQSMTFLLPELANSLTVESSGTIGLDETLDLSLTIRLPQQLSLPPVRNRLTENPAFAFLGQLLQEPIRLQVSGTVSEPVLGMPDGLALLDEISRRIDPEHGTQEPPPVTQAVFEIIRSAGQADQDQAGREVPGSVLNLIRAIKAEKERADRERPPRPPRKKR